MRLFPLNKALLWKEWKQNRWLFWVGMVILNFNPILISLLKWIVGSVDPVHHDPHLYNWLPILVNYPSNIVMFQLGVIAAPVLGGALLGQERGFVNPLEFLAASPVSRREILCAKYLTGLKMLWMVIGVNLLFVYLLACFFPWVNNWYGLFGIYVARGLALTAIYSMCFCLSTICGNFYSSVFGSLGIVFGPFVLVKMLEKFSGRYDIFTTVNSTLYKLYLPNYVMSDLSLQNFVIPVMLVLSLLFYYFAVKLFERNPFEKNGRILMFGDFFVWFKWLAPLFLAFSVAGQLDDSLGCLVVFLLTFGVLFGVLHVVQRIRRSFDM